MVIDHDTTKKLITSLKNDRPLCEVRVIVVNMCAGLLQWPNIFANAIIISRPSTRYTVYYISFVHTVNCDRKSRKIDKGRKGYKKAKTDEASFLP